MDRKVCPTDRHFSTSIRAAIWDSKNPILFFLRNLDAELEAIREVRNDEALSVI